jgi:hypothetical protein
VRNLLVVLSFAGALGAIAFAVSFVLGHAPNLLLRLLACVLVIDHASLTALYLLQPTRVQILGLLLRGTAPLVVIVGLIGMVQATKAGTVGEGASAGAAVTVAFSAALIALGALTIVYLAREGEGRPTV